VGTFSASIHSRILQLNFPTPAHAVIRVFTPAGREVFHLQQKFAKGSRRISLHPVSRPYAAGVYHVCIESNGRRFVAPMMLVN
jgi:hypothetical protein